jgi:hypothetical protein
MLTDKKVCEVAVHFNENKHEFKDLEFVPIEKVDLVNGENTNNPLLTREAYWRALMASIRDLNFDQKIGSITSCNNYYNYIL